mmetsp:Transcript_36304/g.43877  ORF Transcript_36304/g.43877 Transcript_36304/m.43877 type:complete len:284 (-) Transcript_36304:1723-2574(-)
MSVIISSYSMRGSPTCRRNPSSLFVSSASWRSTSEDTMAIPPMTDEIIYKLVSSHFSGSLPALTLSYATAMSVPSFRMVMVTNASTGIEKYCGHCSLSLSSSLRSSYFEGSKIRQLTKKKKRSCTVHATRYITKFFIRVNILREVTMAVTMVVRPGSVSTISALALAASVEPLTAMPTSARFKAGESFTPSPVMPTMYPRCLNASTMRYLCSGNTCAKPSDPSINGPYSSPSGLLSNSSGLFTGSVSGPSTVSPIPRRLHISTAMALWSPVIIFTPTPNILAF